MFICILIYIVILIHIYLKKQKRFPPYKDKKLINQIVMCIFVTNTIAFLIFIVDLQESKKYLNGNIIRNDYGKGKKIEELEISIGKNVKNQPIELEVQERKYNKKEIKKLFSEIIKGLDNIILGDNKSKDKVYKNMNLIHQYPGTPVQISWELSQYDVMNINGEIQSDNLKEEGTVVEIKGLLSYEGEELLYTTNVCIVPADKTIEQKVASAVKGLAKKADDNTKENKSLHLPDKYEGEVIHWSKKSEKRGYFILILGCTASVFIVLLKKQNVRKETIERKNQMKLDYPEIVNKFMLLLEAGMTVKSAWNKIVSDYRVHRNKTNIRHAYEEMNYTLHELQSGVAEADSYERFGRRCGIQEYLKLGVLFSQNLRKGTKGLTQILKLEAAQAFEERKNMARRLGEEASTKLLLPMFIMLAVVLLIVIVPAFLSIKI